jgi:hypothetical protein
MAAGLPPQTFGGLEAQSSAFFSGAKTNTRIRIN